MGYSLRKWVRPAVGGVVLVAGISQAHAEINVGLLLGKRSLDSELWAPVDSQSQYGLMFDVTPANWVVNLALDLLYASESVSGTYAFGNGSTLTGSIEGTSQEYDFGLRKHWTVGKTIHPYAGGGISFITGEVSATQGETTESVSDHTVGIWLGGGANYRFWRRLNVGVDLRYSTARMAFFGDSGEAGATQFGVHVGYHWD